MKFFALLCIVGFAAASSIGQSKVQWQDDHEYKFQYEGRLLTGLPQLNSQYSGLGIKCNVHLKVLREETSPSTRRFTLRITEPRYVRVNNKLVNERESEAQRNWRTLQLPPFQEVGEEAKRELEKPSSFDLLFDGRFDSMTIGQNEPEWSVNFKKAIVILFQTQFKNMEFSGTESNMISEDKTSMIYWTTSEESLDGLCQVDYQVNEIPERKAEQLREFYTEECRNSGDRRYEIVKTRNIGSCSQRNTFSFYKPGFLRCSSGNCNGQVTKSSITRYYACGNSIESLKIQTIVNEGELEQDIFGERTEKFLTGNSQVLKLVEKSSVSYHDSVPSDSVTIKSPAYTYHSKKEGLSSGNGQQFDSELESAILPRQMIASGFPSGKVGKYNPTEIIRQIVKLVKELVREDLRKNQDIADREISMKGVSLARGFSMLKHEEIRQAYQQLKGTFTSEEERTTMKNIVFDTIMMGGTRSCVLFIKEQILSGEVSSQSQMVSFFMMMPHYLVTPTETILEEIYELVRSQKVQQYPIVYNQAILSYSALIQRACLSENRQTSYPTRVMGEFCSPKSQVVQNKWIPYLQSQVYQRTSESKRSDSVEWRNLHLVSLGLMKHKAVLPTLLEFVERQQQRDEQQSSDATRLTRFLAIYSLSNAGSAQPKRTMQTLHSVLKNQSERTEIRIAAFNALLKMNPEMYIFQSIASMTWRESNKEVLNVINSAFFTLAHQKDIPVLEIHGSSIRRKAVLVHPLIKWSRQLSSITTNTADRLPMLDMSYNWLWSWTSTKGNSFSLPTDYYSRMVYLLNRYQYTACEASMRLEGLDNLAQQIIENIHPGSRKTKSQVGQKIVEKLNSEWRKVIQNLDIKNRDNVGAQASLFVKVFEDTPIFYNLQSSSAESLSEKFSKWGVNLNRNQICGQHKVNMQRVIDASPAEFLIPSDMGFPILVEVRSPKTVSIRGQVNVECSGSGLPSVDMDIQALAASQYSGFVGTVCPFTEEFVATSVEEATIVNLPTQIKFQYNHQQQEFQIRLTPFKSNGQDHIDILHQHIKPYTVNQALYDLTPLRLSRNTKYIKSETQMWEKTWDICDYMGLKMQTILDTESRFKSLATLVQKFKMYNYSLGNVLRFLYASTAVSERGYPSLRSHHLTLRYYPNVSNAQEIDIKVQYGLGQKVKDSIKYTMVKVSNDVKEQQWPLTYPSWQKVLPVELVSKPIGQGSEHQERQQKIKSILENTGVENGRALTIKGSVTIKGSQRPRVMTWSLNLGTGLDQLKEKWNIELHKGEQKKLCIRGHATPQGQLASMDIEEIRQNPVTVNFENVIGYGSSCTEKTVKFSGYAKTSGKQIERSRTSEEAKQYNELKSRNSTLAKLSNIASVVREQASLLDEVKVTVEGRNSYSAKRYNYIFVNYVKSIWWPYYHPKDNQDSLESSGSNSGDDFKNVWLLDFNSKTNTFNAEIQLSEETVKFEAVQLPYWAGYFTPINGQSRVQYLKGQSSPNMLHKKCEVSGDLLSTFEKRLIPHKIDDCYHVVSADCSFKKSFAVLARSVESQNPKGPKEVKIISGYTSIVLSPSSSGHYGSSNGLVKVNGSEISLPSSTMTPKYIKDNKGDLIATIFKTKEGGIEVATVLDNLTKSNILTVKYFGSFFQVLVDSSLRSELCGTCGEMNGDKLASLRGPKKCYYSKPQLLVASYRVSTEEKQCGSLENSIGQQLRQEQEQCRKTVTLPSQVSQSYKVSGGKCTRHIHLVIERSQETCFSKRPVPQCGLTCKANSESSKTVSYTCLPSGSRMAQLYKQKVQNGQTIEQLSGMETSFQVSMELPRSCSPYNRSL